MLVEKYFVQSIFKTCQVATSLMIRDQHLMGFIYEQDVSSAEIWTGNFPLQ